MKNLKIKVNVVMAVLLSTFLLACEKPYVDEEGPVAESSANLVLRVSGFDMIPFSGDGASRASQEVSDVCSRINFVVYNDEKKVQSIAQKRGDSNFGTATLTLPQGDYKIAVIAHSSTASASIPSLDKISFEKNLLTDTFLKYLEVTVGEEAQTIDLELQRVVAMFRLSLTENLPDNIRQMKFYYTGGSSTLDATTGFGSVNSKQTVVLDVAEGQRVFEVYTIPHAETDELKMTISAMDEEGVVLKERAFEAVPVQRNFITCYSGNFFDDAAPEPSESSFSIKLNTEWAGINETQF